MTFVMHRETPSEEKAHCYKYANYIVPFSLPWPSSNSSEMLEGNYVVVILGRATQHLACRKSVRQVKFLNCEQFSHCCSCPSIRDWIAVYIRPCCCWWLLEIGKEDRKSWIRIFHASNLPRACERLCLLSLPILEFAFCAAESRSRVELEGCVRVPPKKEHFRLCSPKRGRCWNDYLFRPSSTSFDSVHSVTY